jgi:hypothetical protein
VVDYKQGKQERKEATEMSSTAPEYGDDLSDESLRAALERFHADLRTRAAVDASDFSTYATIYRTAQAYTNRDCGPAVAATKRDQTFRWHLRSVAGEFACDAQLTDNSLMNRAHNANDLFTKFPYWHDALSEAAVQVGHVNAMLRQHTPVAERHYERYGKEVLRYAKTHTVPQTESFAKQLAAKLAREDFERAHKAAFAQRRVLVDQDDYGMAYLTAYLPAATAAAIHERLSRDAQAMAEVAKAEATARRGEDGFEADARTLDQHRADILADTLLTATAQTILESPAAGAARVKAVISIVTPVMALRDQQFSDAFRRAGGSDTCAGVAMLNGLQPMSAAEARDLPVPWLPQARTPLRPRPHDRVAARRQDPSRKLRPPLRRAPHTETRTTLASPPPRRRRTRVDHTPRTGRRDRSRTARAEVCRGRRSPTLLRAPPTKPGGRAPTPQRIPNPRPHTRATPHRQIRRSGSQGALGRWLFSEQGPVASWRTQARDHGG